MQLRSASGTLVFADVTVSVVHACYIGGELSGPIVANCTGSVSISYAITFAGGVGVLTGSEGGDTGVAAVDILPTGGDCVSDVTPFTATVAGVDAQHRHRRRCLGGPARSFS